MRMDFDDIWQKYSKYCKIEFVDKRIMFKCVQIMCAKYYQLRYMFYKIALYQSWRVC